MSLDLLDCCLHQGVFNNDLATLSQLLNQNKDALFTTLKDLHGNTPLHLAVMLGRKECVDILLEHQHPVNVKNADGWTPLQEAVSYGDRSTIKQLLLALNEEKKKERANRRPEVKNALDSFGGDFFVKMTWDFQSWFPFVSRILPSDICKIYRKGNRIRMDSTLEDFSDRHWVRGDLSYIIDFEGKGDAKILLLDNKKKEYFEIEQLTPEEKAASIEESVNLLMSGDISDGTMKTSRVSIDRITTGWLFRRDKTELVGQFEADFYRVTGLMLVTRKRREHLSEEDIRKNKSIRNAFSRGEDAEKVLEECQDLDQIEKRDSLAPPTPKSLSWNDYINATTQELPHLGREKREKTSQKSFEATLGISQNFPIKLEDLLPILEAIGPKAKVFSKLRDFVTLQLPRGFPVRIDIPIFPTIKATVSFPEFQFRSDLPSSMFTVPSDFTRLPPDHFEKKANENKKK